MCPSGTTDCAGSDPAVPVPSTRAVSRGRFPRWVALIFALALLLRATVGIVMLCRADPPTRLEFPDERQYWQMAQSLRAGEGLRDELGFRATRMPLYPGLLSLFAGTSHGVIPAKVLQWIVGAMVPALMAGAAASLFGPRIGIVAGVIGALDPFFIFFSTLLLTETMFLAAITGLWWATSRVLAQRGTFSWNRWIAVALAAVACIYLRESSVGLVAILLCWVIGWNRLRRDCIIGTAVVACCIFLSLLPWAWRNARVTRDWCFLTHRGGISLYDGVGPRADGSSNLGRIKQMPAVRGLNEVEWNRYFLRESFRCIRENPRRVARLARTKVGRMWNPVPNVGSYQSAVVRAISAAWTLPVFSLALVGIIGLAIMSGGRGWWVNAYLLLPAIYLTGVHSLFVGSVRYRLGAMPMIELLCAVGAGLLARRWGLAELGDVAPMIDRPSTTDGLQQTNRGVWR